MPEQQVLKSNLMTNVDRILSEMQQLNDQERNLLTDRLLELVPDERNIAPMIDEAWRAEVRRRCEKIESGETKLIPWEEVRADLFSK